MGALLRPALAAALAVAFVTGRAGAVELRSATLSAFNRYVRLTESRMATELAGASPFLWIDRQPRGERDLLLARLRRGEVPTARLQTRDGGRPIETDGALIHHWIGTVLLPNAALARVLGIAQRYNRYGEWFGPTITRARLLAADEDRFKVQMRTSTRRIITVVVDAEYDIDYRHLSPSRVYSRSEAVRLWEIKSPGASDERRVPVDETGGFLWRLNTYCSFEERAEGTYEQCESVSLTRGIPFGLGPVVSPLVTSIPRETLEFILGRMRELAVRSS